MTYPQSNMVTADYPNGQQNFNPQGGSLTANQTIAAYLGNPRSPVESWQIFGGGTAGVGMSTSGLATTTWQHQFATRQKAYAVRLTYVNPLVATPTIDKTTITPSTTYVQDGDPTGGATPVNITWATAASITLATAPSTNEESLNSSDWTLISPLDRTDIVGAPYLWHIRSYCALSGQPYQNALSTLAYVGNVAGGLIRRGSTMTGDKIATPAGYSGTNGGLILGMALEFRGLSRCLRLGAIGDSIVMGTEGAGIQCLDSYAEGACNIVNNSLAQSAVAQSAFWSSMNFGWGGQSYAQIAQRLPSILSAFSLDAMIIPVWSPNSFATTQALQDAQIGAMLDMIARCVAARVVPILVTSPPRDSAGNPGDNFRKAVNNIARNVAAVNGYPLADFDTALTNGGTPAAYNPAYSSDGLHPNATGKYLMKQILASVLPKVIPL